MYKKYEILVVIFAICGLSYMMYYQVVSAVEIIKQNKIRTYIDVQQQKKIEKQSIKIAKVLNIECGDCPDVDKLLIGSSLLNRVDNKDFPNTLDEVINQPNQYKTSKTYTEHDKKLAVCLLEDYFRDCNVIYFYNPKTATDKRFLSQMKRKKLIVQTEHHNYR